MEIQEECSESADELSTKSCGLFVPGVEENLTPRVRMGFDTLEGANHGFTSPCRMHLSRNRDMTNMKVLLKQCKVANVPAKEQISMLENSCGNCGGDFWKEMRGHDAQMLMDYFEWKKEKDALFSYELQVDCENQLNCCFWVDGLGRINYEHFGDVVSLKVVHDTNRYNLVFVQFVGLNHHLRPVYLGCGLIPNEDENSFLWLIKKWSKVMELPPLSLVTPHDTRIRAAVLTVFPTIRHKFCTCQILDKVSKNLHTSAFLEEFMDPFTDNVWYATSTDEFEEQWKTLIKMGGFESHDLLLRLYECREKWAPIYNKNHFWTGICESQMCKEINALDKIYVSRKSSLHDFVIIFERFLERQREEQLREDQSLLEKKPKLKTLWKMENHMSEIYTSRIFCIFQKELEASLVHNVLIAEDDKSEANYEVNFCGEQENTKYVRYRKSDKMASCSCSMFEFRGIPCRHLLAFLKYSNLCELPEQYIMRRWSQHMKSGAKFASRSIELAYLANQVVAEALTSNDACQMACNGTREVIEQLLFLKNKDDERRSGKRFKPTSEECNPQDRTCIYNTFRGCEAQQMTNLSNEALCSCGELSEGKKKRKIKSEQVFSSDDWVREDGYPGIIYIDESSVGHVG